MDSLASYCRTWASKAGAKQPSLRVIISDASTPGEGEYDGGWRHDRSVSDSVSTGTLAFSRAPSCLRHAYFALVRHLSLIHI